MEVIRQAWWIQAEEAAFISNLGRSPSLSLVTHLAIGDSGSNLIHKFRHSLPTIRSHVTRILGAIGYVSKVIVDLFQGTSEVSVHE